MLAIKVRGLRDESVVFEYATRIVRRMFGSQAGDDVALSVVVEPVEGHEELTRCAISSSSRSRRLVRVEYTDRNVLTAIALAAALLVPGLEEEAAAGVASTSQESAVVAVVPRVT